MLTFDKIKNTLFSSTEEQTLFELAAAEYRIPGKSFEEKLSYVLYSAPEEHIQLILAPFLRRRTILHRALATTYSTRASKEAAIETKGGVAWAEAIECALKCDERQTIASEMFEHQKTAFLNAVNEQYPEFQTDLESVWYSMIASDHILDLSRQRASFVHSYDTEEWTTQASSDEESTSTSAGHPEAKKAFKQIKTAFLRSCSLKWWSIANQVSSEPDGTLAKFLQMRDTFIKDHGHQQWQERLTASTDSDHVHQEAKFDADSEDPFDPIMISIQQIFEQVKNDFILEYGKFLWERHLFDQLQDRTHGTDQEAVALCDLFDLGFATTPVNHGQLQTLIDFTEGHEQTIHLYCENNIHWYIYGSGYDHTIGDGNCLYNGFAQGLRLLLQNRPTNPAPQIRIRLNEDQLMIATVQQQRLSSNLNLTSSESEDPRIWISEYSSEQDDRQLALETAYRDMMTIHAIHKEFGLIDDKISPEELKNFLLEKTDILLSVLSKYNPLRPLYKAILIEIGKMIPTATPEDSCALKDLLSAITDTLHIPGTANVPKEWDDAAYQNNKVHLQQIGTKMAESTSKNFRIIGKMVNDLTGQGNQSRPLDDWLALAGIYAIVIGITALLTVLLLALSGGTAILGSLLLATKLKVVITGLSAIVGWSLPQSAVVVTTTLGCTLTAGGYRLFKDYASESLSDMICDPFRQMSLL